MMDYSIDYSGFAPDNSPLSLTLVERLVQLSNTLMAMTRRFEGLLMDYSMSMILHEDFHAAFSSFGNLNELGNIVGVDELRMLIEFLDIQGTDGDQVSVRNYILRALNLCHMISGRIDASDQVSAERIAPFAESDVVAPHAFNISVQGELNGAIDVRVGDGASSGAVLQADGSGVHTWVNAVGGGNSVTYAFNGLPEQIVDAKKPKPVAEREPSLAEVWGD